MTNANLEIELTTEYLQQLKKENLRLRRAVDELAILNDLSLAISGSLDSEKIMRSIIGKSIRAMEAEQGDITLIAEDEQNPAQTLVRSMVSSSDRSPLHLNQNLLGWMQINKKPLMINEPEDDERFRNVKWDPSINSVLSAPLMVRSKLTGILTVYNKTSGSAGNFTESDQRLLSIIAAQSAQVVETARLYEEEEAYRFMRRELDLASEIQKKMLPAQAPQIDRFAVAGTNVTAREVGGDYFDYIRMDDHRWALCLGDISGKGLPASLLMSNLQAILRGQVLHLLRPGEILKMANRQLFQSTGSEKFATLFIAVLDTEANTLHYSSAGHEYPFIFKNNGNYERLSTGGLPLGIMNEQEYEEEIIDISVGDTLFIFSDGVTDSINPEEEMMGEHQLIELLIGELVKNSQPEDLIKSIVDACLTHSGKEKLFDDITAMALKRNQ